MNANAITQVFYFKTDETRTFTYDKKLTYVIAELGNGAFSLERAKKYIANVLDCPLIHISFQRIEAPRE